MKQALKEINSLREERDKYYKEVLVLKKYISTLTLDTDKIKTDFSNSYVNNILTEANAAMKRYTNKLRKECEKYAKQKQSKRQ